MSVASRPREKSQLSPANVDKCVKPFLINGRDGVQGVRGVVRRCVVSGADLSQEEHAAMEGHKV